MKKLLILFLLFTQICVAQVVPKLYYTFDLSNPLAPAVGSTNLTSSGFGVSTTVVTNGVGKSIQMLNSTPLKGGNAAIDTSITISFMFKPDYLFSTVRDPQLISYGSSVIYLQWPNLRFITKLTNGFTDNLLITLDGVGPANYQYYLNKWTHFSFVYNANTGFKGVYVDGTCPAGFSTVLTTTGVISTAGTDVLTMNGGSASYQKVNGWYDEIAVYSKALTSAQVYQQYTDISNNQHYSGGSAAAIPPPASVVASKRITDYAKGYVLGSGTSITVTNSPRTQLTIFPLPRFKPGHTMPPNIPWVDQKYFAEYLQPNTTTDAAVVDSSKRIMAELVTNWNYYALVSDHVQNRRSDYADTTNKFAGAWVAQANRNSSWKTCAISYWDQMRPNTAGFSLTTSPYILNKNLPPFYYLRNGSGQYLDKAGAVTTVVANRVISPIAPFDSIYQDGLTLNTHLTTLDNYLNRPLNYLSENCEVLPKWNNTALNADPSVVSSKPGSLTMEEYQAVRRATLFKNAYVAKFGSNPILSGASIMLYNQTAWDGTFAGIQNFSSTWSYMRDAQGLFNGRKYATMDLYARWPNNWRNWVTAWRGLQPFLECKNVELASGDSLQAPFIGAGWDMDEEKNIRNGQWMGLLKIYASLGAEFFHVGYFNEGASYSKSNPPANPRGYVNQMTAPIYVQAITSRWESIFRNGSYLAGDVPLSYTTPSTAKSFLYYSGSYQVVTSIRNSGNDYIITTTYQPMNNMDGGQDTIVDAKITFLGTTYQFKSRRQGSVYYYNSAKDVFYQLDEWHEASYPEWWTKDIKLQAEVNDYGTPPVKTYGQSGNDYRNAYSVISYADTATVFDSIKYVVSPRTTGTQYVWFKARIRSGSTGDIYFRVNGAVDTVKNITSTDWYWYRYNNGTATKFSYSLTANASNILSLIVSNKYVEIDEILFTQNASLTLPEPNLVCTFTTHLTFVSGDSILCPEEAAIIGITTPNPAYAYVWNNGATTSTITASSTNNYWVTVYDGAGCLSHSDTIRTTLYPSPTAPVFSKIGGTICYGDSVRILGYTPTPSITYLWSTGNTTDNIWTTIDGYYQLTITSNKGCSIQADTLIVFNPVPITPTFSVSGQTTKCNGDSLKLFSNQSYDNYLWYRLGVIVSSDSSFYAKNPGWYTLTAVNASGCIGTSVDSVLFKWYNCDTCERPRNLVSSGITKTSATISWSSTTGATYFVVYLKNIQTGNIIKSTVPGNIRKTKFSVLSALTYYQYYIDAICSNGETIRSTTKTFKTPIR